MRIPLAIGGILVLLVCGGWVAGDVDFAIYPLLGAPLAGFFAGWRAGREMPVFFATASVTALCLALWAAARNDLRRDGGGGRPGSGPAEFQPR